MATDLTRLGKQNSITERTVVYRPDIDGLRAIAVLSVLGYHLRMACCRGGFVGVDVFFVISGYLISAVILKDIHSEKFSLVSFYERRVRRIFPALIAMLICTSLIAYLCFLPSELVSFAKSLVAAVFSASNFYFWNTSGYFSAPVETKPLIHTWSLAVEEQFYVFLPMFLYLAHRFFPRKMRLSIILIALSSLALSAVGAFRHPTATFYLPHTRAWELLLGVLISLDAFPEISGPVFRNAAAFGGLALISAAVFVFTTNTPFPGLAALLPCVGAALVIAAGRSGTSVVARMLSLKPVVFLGLISYSLYLWHWPIIVFQGMESFLVTGFSMRVVKLACVAVSFVVATLSWKYVESPFRTGRKCLSRPTLFKLTSSACALAATIGIVMITANGFPFRYPRKAIQVASYLEYNSAAYFRDGHCFISSGYKFNDFDVSECLGKDLNKKNYLLFGDSHAAQLWYGLSTTLNGVNVLQATGSGCKPMLEQPLLASDTCQQLMGYIFKNYLPSHRVDRVLIAARWQEGDLAPLAHTLDWMKQRGISVVVFGPMVQYDTALPRLLAFSIREDDPEIPDEHRLDQRSLNDSLRRIADQEAVDFVSLYESLCGPRSCAEFGANGVPLQFDYGHLTKEGSILVAQRLFSSGQLQ
jgi:peptidoglycan/LPS O-acetylase OafA/YrhL